MPAPAPAAYPAPPNLTRPSPLRGAANPVASIPIAANPAAANPTGASPIAAPGGDRGGTCPATALPPAGPRATRPAEPRTAPTPTPVPTATTTPAACSGGLVPAVPALRAGLAGPIPADPSAGEHVLPAGTWPVRWGHHDGLELGALLAAVPCARARAREVLREWGLAALAPDAEIIVAELAANAIKATRVRVEGSEGPGFIKLWMLGDLSRLLILAWDPTHFPPVLGDPGSEDEHGRGLLLVDALAARWRWYYPARPYGGKVVWALLEVAQWPGAGAAGAAAAEAGPGNDRSAGAGPAEDTGPRRLAAVGR